MQNAKFAMQPAPDQGAGSKQELSGESPHVLNLLRQAAKWHLLARLFECPTVAWRQDVRRLASEVDDPDLQGAAEAALVTATEGQYHSVFGPGGPAPPREVSYYDSIELGSLMSELTGYYGAFGYRPAVSEPPDHVAVEAGFVAYLHFKEAYATAGGDRDHAATTAAAAAQFRAHHLAVLAKPLAAVLADSDIPYLMRASALLTARAGEPPSHGRLPVIQPPVDDESGAGFSCADVV